MALGSSILNKPTVRSAVFDFLRSQGVRRIFGNPGSTELPMFRDFPSDFEYILGLQESIVVGMADGHAQATRLASVVNLHSAAGVGHAMGSLFTAMRNQAPMVIIAGQQARSMLLRYPVLFSERASELPLPYVKWSIEPARAEDVPEAIARAFRVAMQPPFGPTFVSVPRDDWDRPCEPVQLRQIIQRARPESRALDMLGEALSSARRPALVAGPGIAQDGAWDEIVALAERSGAAVFGCFPISRSVFPENHPLFAGFLSGAPAEVRAALKDHDLVVIIGAPVFTFHFEGTGSALSDGTTVFQLIDDPVLAASAAMGTTIVASPKAALIELLGRVNSPREVAATPLRPPAAALNKNRFTDAVLVERVADLRPTDSVVVLEAPSTTPAVQRHLPTIKPDSYFGNASGGLGWGMPAAVGVALGCPHRRTIAIIGDGSTMYAVQALWSAAELQAPVTFIIVRNGGYVVLEDVAHGFGLNTVFGTSLAHLDFISLAKAQGVEGWRVDDFAALEDALKIAFSASGPNLIEAVVNRVADPRG